jgi:hypothetical protein
MIMKWLSVAAMGGLACGLSGCLFVSANVQGDLDGANGYGRLLGAEVSAMRPEVTITAPSNGCTEKAHFETEVHNHDNVADVGFKRIQEDRCRALMPEGRRLTWTFAELGIEPGASVRVMNPIGR